MERIAEQKNLEAKIAATGVVFYAVSDIAAGATITGDSVRNSEELRSGIPQDAVQDLPRVIGRKTKYGLSAGQLLSYHELVPNVKSEEHP